MSRQRKKSRLNERFNFSSVQDYENIKLSQGDGELFQDTEFVSCPAVLTADVEGQDIVINYMGKTHVRHVILLTPELSSGALQMSTKNVHMEYSKC